MPLVRTVQNFYDDLKLVTKNNTIPEAWFLKVMEDAISDLVLHTKILHGYHTIASVSGQQDYACPPDFLAPYRIEYNGYELTQVHRNDIPGEID